MWDVTFQVSEDGERVSTVALCRCTLNKTGTPWCSEVNRDTRTTAVVCPFCRSELRLNVLKSLKRSGRVAT